jgi:hypothetical protein
MNRARNSGSGAVPTVIAVAEQLNEVAPNRKQEVQFSEAMDPATINTKILTAADSAGDPVAGVVGYDTDYNIASFQPNPAFQANATYSNDCHRGNKHGRTRLATGYTYTFTTRAEAAQSSLEILKVDPAANATCVSATSPIIITFDEVPDASDINASNIIVKGPDGSILKMIFSTNITTTQISRHARCATPLSDHQGHCAEPRRPGGAKDDRAVHMEFFHSMYFGRRNWSGIPVFVGLFRRRQYLRIQDRHEHGQSGANSGIAIH